MPKESSKGCIAVGARKISFIDAHNFILGEFGPWTDLSIPSLWRSGGDLTQLRLPLEVSCVSQIFLVLLVKDLP